MKKYLLFIISMLCVSIGTWAQDPDPATSGKFGASENSDWELTGTSPNQTLTLTFKDANDKPLVKEDHTDWVNWLMPCDITGVTKVVVNTASGITLSGGADSPLASLSDNYKSIPLLDLSEASVNIASQTSGTVTSYYLPIADASYPTPLTFKNIIVPASFANNPDGLIVCNRWSYNQSAAVNKFSVSGTTINAALYTAVGDIAVLTDIKSDYTKLKIVNEVGAIDLTSVLPAGKTLDLTSITTASNNSNTITVNSGTNVVCLTSGVADRVSGATPTIVNPVVSCKASELITKLGNLSAAGVTPTSVTIKDEDAGTDVIINSEVMTALNGCTSLIRINLQDATLSGVTVANIAIPSTLECLTLPKSEDPKASFDAMKTNIEGKTALYYVYAPYSGTQDKDQMVADYVWVNKPGGLSKAFDEQTRLLSAWYMIVESTVALNDDDVNFWGSDPEHARSMQYRYLDLSGANITPAVLANYKVTDELPYRIILPNDWTGDMMAVFAANPNKGSIAAVYSYTGTDHKRLDILELNDYAYLPTALSDSRIVRSGTTSIRVVSGHYGNNPVYSKFGDNLLTAINGAASSITSVTIAVGSGIYESVDTNSDSTDDKDQTITGAKTFAFDNDNLTNLDLSYTNNSNVTIDVSGCANLANFQMNEATVAAVDAHGITFLATVSLGHTTVGSAGVGDVNLSGTSLATQLEVDLANIAGTLNISNTQATSYDLTQLTAKSVNASNTNSMTSLNINGISLNGDVFTPNDDTQKDGKIDVTRSSNNYSGLTITRADAFNATRIIPSTGGYTTISIHEAKVEITVEGNSLTDVKVNEAVAAYNNAHASDPSYTAGTKANVKVLHVTGTLTADDITYIKNNLTALQLLDLSGCTFADGVSVSTIISAPIPTSTAIVLPGLTNDESVILTDVKTLQDAGFECVAYYTSKANKRLNVYAYSGTVGKLKSSSPAVIDNATGITFLPRYYDTTPESSSNQYPEVQPSLLTALGTLPPFSIDMTWLNIDKLGVDFRGLNENTHYLVIPQNSSAATITRSGIVYHNDFTTTGTDGVVDGTDHKYFHFGENIYAVSTYKSQSSPWGQKAYFGGEATELGPWIPNKQSTANLTYVNSTGHLGDCIPYMSTRQTGAEIHAIAGAVNSTDITSLNSASVTNSYLDLSRSTLSGDITWSSYSNASVKIIVMPHEYTTTASGLPTVGSCAQLYGIGCHLLSDVDASNGAKKCTLVYMAQKEGGMADMIKASNRIHPGLATRYNRVTSLIVGGPVNAFDLSTRTDGIDANGHLVTTVENNNITGLGAGTKGGALNGYADIEGWDLSAATLPIYTEGANVTADNRSYRFDNHTHAYATSDSSEDGFSYQNDLCYSLLGIAMPSLLTDVTLPTSESVWRIADKALEKCKLITNDELHIPHNYQYIGNGAFLDTEIGHITTTDATGNLIDNGAKTYTLSANLKEIGNNPGAGNGLNSSQTVFPQNNGVTDVYILAHKVPLCYKNAFPANMTYGWGGFKDASTPYCREKYENTPFDGSRIMTILRFPDKQSFTEEDGAKEGTYEAMQRKYTDVTKVYTKKEQTGAVDANGNEILWPTFSELNRAYNQATAGLIWDDWKATYSIAGGVMEVQEGNVIPTSTAPAAKGNAGEGNHATLITTEDNPEYQFSGYEGWHQFVLSQATYVEPDVLNNTERNFVEGGWYTFCIPFDLTESQVYEMLGVPYSNARYTNKVGGNTIKKAGDGEPGIERILPNIRTLASVTRKPGNTNQISLLLTSNMVSTSAGENTFYYYNIKDADPASSALAPITETIGGEKIAIKGGYPYYIKPYLPEGVTVTNLGKYVMTRYADIFKLAASCQRNAVTKESINNSDLATLQFAKPFEKHKIQAYLDKPGEEGYTKHHDNDVDPSNDKKYYYTFIGQFWDQKLPRYCYYTMEGTGNWYRFTNFTNESLYKWYAYKCVILVTQEVDDTATHPTSGKFRDATNCFYPTIKESTTDQLNGTLKLAFLDGIDDFDFVNSSRECIFLFDEDIMDLGDGSETTSIESLDGENIVPSTQGKVYNMAGQHVGNSLEGLSKGMYIMNGKKYVIK